MSEKCRTGLLSRLLQAGFRKTILVALLLRCAGGLHAQSTIWPTSAVPAGYQKVQPPAGGGA